MKKDITIYAQRNQSNGFTCIHKFTRINGVWSWGREKTDKKPYFDMQDEDNNDMYFYHLLLNNYDAFSTKMDSNNMTKEQLSNLIFQ